MSNDVQAGSYICVSCATPSTSYSMLPSRFPSTCPVVVVVVVVVEVAAVVVVVIIIIILILTRIIIVIIIIIMHVVTLCVV